MYKKLLVLILVPFLLISCSKPEPQSQFFTEPPPLTTRTYDVPTHTTERLYDKFRAPEPQGKLLAYELRDYMQTRGYYPCATPHQLRSDIDGEGYQLWCTYGNGEFQGRYFIHKNQDGSYGEVVIEEIRR
jgi:hypothetical protein